MTVIVAMIDLCVLQAVQAEVGHTAEHRLKSFLNEELGLYCEFIKAENPNLIGAAIAGLLNA